jgi:hypothetical protein
MLPNVKITRNDYLYSSSLCQTVIVDHVVASYKLKPFVFSVTSPSDWLVVIVDSLRIKKYTSSVESLNFYFLVIINLLWFIH